MSWPATERALASARPPRGSAHERGSALVGVLVVMLGIMGILYATSTISTVDLRDSRRSMDDLRAKHLATAGAELGLHTLQGVVDKNSLDPLGSITTLLGGEDTITLYSAEPILDGEARIGAVTVSMTLLDQSATEITVALDSTGYLPDAPTALAEGQMVESWYAVRSVLRFSLAPSRVFDYAYFINNWGWFYANTLFCNGNARSNGQFDCAGYTPTITGQPLYDEVDWNGSTATLSGYEDDNGDGLQDGQDGGVWSGWDIVGAQNVQGNGGQSANQHDFESGLDMPNLNDLSMYEASATSQGGSITIGGVEVSDAIYGDEPGELGNLYLVGTVAAPIVLNGPVVVHGDVIISGVVTGQGAIYGAKNVYVPKSLTYKDPPGTPRPADNTQAATETWLASNWSKDFLGLFATENVVVGDHTNSTWQYYQKYWMGDDMNSSAEDAGADNIPNTLAGRDGILGTADDDVLEGDGLFTVEYYSEADDDAGLIPAGKNVGDVIPGSGEDIDGDGLFDDSTTLADVILTTPLDTANWGGNMPASGYASYKDISSLYANQLDAVFYTNHSFCWVVFGGTPAKINGSVVCRNENIVYGTPTASINYDARLLGGRNGMAADFLPSVLEPVEVLRWMHLDRDPNRHVEP